MVLTNTQKASIELRPKIDEYFTKLITKLETTYQ